MRRTAISAVATLTLGLALGLAGCSSSSSTPSTSPSSAASQPTATSTTIPSGKSVTISNFAFDPAAITAPAGSAIAWTNQDSTAHTVTFDDTSIKSSGNLAQGDTFTATFPKPGTYAYHCAIHPSMTGTVTIS